MNRKVIIALVLLVVLSVGLVTGVFLFFTRVQFVDTSIQEEADSTYDIEPEPVAADVGSVLEWFATPREYRPYSVFTLDYEVGDAILREGWIYFAGLQNSTIRIQRMRLGASLVETVTEIPSVVTAELIAGFDMTADGTIRLVIRDRADGGQMIYTQYDSEGNQILARELEAPSFFAAGASINRYITSFLADGSIVIDGHDRFTCDVFLYVFDADGDFVSMRHSGCGSSALTRGGQVVSNYFDRAPNAAVYALDPLIGDWEARPFESDFNLRQLRTGAPDSNFDFYISINQDGELSLYGFVWETEALVRLINWDDEPGFRPRWVDTLIIAPDGQIVLFRHNQSNWVEGTFVLVLPYGIQGAV